MKILLLLAIFLVSCASPKKIKEETKEKEDGGKKEEKEDPDALKGPEKRIVGRIASVSKAGKFVLIQRLGNGTLPGNVLYQARGPEGRAASLRPSGERVRDFYAADLLSGTVEVGDAVVAYLNPQKKKENPDETEGSGDAEEAKPKKTEASLKQENESESDQDPKTIKDSD